MILDYVEQHKDPFGVEPICTALTSAGTKIAPSAFYAARTRPPSARAVRDVAVSTEIGRVHKENYGVYGIRKIHAQLTREMPRSPTAFINRPTVHRATGRPAGAMFSRRPTAASATSGPQTTLR